MKKSDKYNFAIIGAGKVGTAVGHLLKKAGHRIVAVYDKSASATKKSLPYTGGKAFCDSRKAASEADIILITTPDDTISKACSAIAIPELIDGKFVFHMSGAGGVDLLDAARKSGACIAAIHPVQSFSSVKTAIRNLPGSVFGISADGKAKKQAVKIVRDLKGIPVFISSGQKPLYHAAACFASNYLVALLHVVELIYESVGINKVNARKAYLPLVYGTLKNIEASGTVEALTGPIARGDISTIEKHIKAIKKTHPGHSSLYSILGILTANIARKKGTMSLKQANIIKSLLKGVNKDEHSK